MERSFLDGQIVVKPLDADRWTLDELLAGVHPGNLHRETDTGASVGNEAW